MKRVALILSLLPALSWAAGPRFHHKDPLVEQEFRNAYHDISGKQNNYGINFSSYTTTSSSSTSANVWVPTNLTATITPRYATSLIRVSATGSAEIQETGAQEAVYSLFRGTSNLGNATRGLFSISAGQSLAGHRPGLTFYLIDAPASISATTYAVYMKSPQSAPVLFGVGEAQVITLEEIVR